MHAIRVCAIGVRVILSQRRLAQAVGVGHITKSMQIVASLSWVCDDRVRRNEGKKPCCRSEDGGGQAEHGGEAGRAITATLLGPRKMADETGRQRDMGEVQE